MRNEKVLFQAETPNEIRDEIAQMRESVELARSDISRTKKDVQRFQDEHESHVRRTIALWVVVVLLVGGLIGFWLYGTSMLREHQGLLGNMPALQSALYDVNPRLTSAEQQINAWANEKLGFSNRMSKIETAVSSNMKSIRNETRTLAQQMQTLNQQIRRDLEQGLNALQNRVNGVESIQREHAEEVARLQNELTGVRQELAAVREENISQTNRISQIEQAHQSTRNDLSTVDRRVNLNQNSINKLASQVDRQRIAFTLPTGRTQQVIDGIYVTVKRADVERQQVDGWLQVARDGRIVWLRDAGAQKPVDFTTQADSRSYQIVFTRIGRDDTAGYLLVPTTPSAASAAESN